MSFLLLGEIQQHGVGRVVNVLNLLSGPAAIVAAGGTEGEEEEEG